MEFFPRIERTRVLTGRFLPAIICNGGQFFFINLQVFEDGLVDCWEMLDLELFKEKLESGWVSTAVPNGKNMSIHHLGSWEIKKGTWLFDEESYFDHVESVVRDLNPEMTNLHNCHGKTTRKVGHSNYSILGSANGKPVRKADEAYYLSKMIQGDHFHSFIKLKEMEYQLVNISVFADSSIRMDAKAEPEMLSIEEFRQQVASGRITTELPVGSSLKIYGFGECEIGACQYTEDMQQKAVEIEDIIAELNGEKTSSQICRALYEEYCSKPTKDGIATLKIAYERIPEHLRRYVLHDQDLKDIPVRMIIYGDEEIKNWSHYAAAKHLGTRLPQIKVPKPKED